MLYRVQCRSIYFHIFKSYCRSMLLNRLFPIKNRYRQKRLSLKKRASHQYPFHLYLCISYGSVKLVHIFTSSHFFVVLLLIIKSMRSWIFPWWIVSLCQCQIIYPIGKSRRYKFEIWTLLLSASATISCIDLLRAIQI